MVTDAFVVAQIPGQRPVVRRDYCDARIFPLMRALGHLAYFFQQLQGFPPGVSVDVNEITIVVVVVNEIEINCLIARNESFPVHRNRRQAFERIGGCSESRLIENASHSRQWAYRH